MRVDTGRSRADAQALAEALRRLATVRPQTGEIFGLAAQIARELLDAPGVVVSTLEGPDLLCRAVSGDVGVLVGARLPSSRSIAGTALRSGEPVLCHDGLADERTDAEHNRSRGVRSSAVAPLLYRGRSLGCISALSPEPSTFADADLRLLAAVADVVASRLSYALALDEQAEVEARLDEQRHLLTAVFDALGEGVVVHDPDGRVVVANPAAEKILDTPLSRMRGSGCGAQPFSFVREDGTELAPEEWPAQVALRSGRRQPPTVLGVRRAGPAAAEPRAWISVSSLPTRDETTGAVTGAVSSFRDITAELAAARDLDRTRRRLLAAQQVTGLATWEWDLASGRLTWSDQMFELVGLAPGSIDPTIDDFLARVHPDDREDCRRLGQDAATRGIGYQNVFRVVHDGGEVRHLLAWTDVARDEHGAVNGLRGATVDVSDRVRATALATVSEERFRIAFDNAPIGMTIVSLRPESLGRVLRANEAFCRMVQRRADELEGVSVDEVTEPADRDLDAERLRVLSSGHTARLSFEKRYRRADGEPVPAWVTTSVTTDDDGRPLYVISHCLDLTERLAAQADLERLALTDTLTGLANRALLGDRIERALARQRRRPGAVALLMLDLDRFKLVNDTLGHLAGDALLVQVADRLRAVCRADATIARLGGDEFVVLVEGLADPVDVQPLVERVLAALREPYELEASAAAIVATASIGVTVAPEAGRRPEDLVREADLALYRAKDAGRDRWALFDDLLRARAVRRVDVEHRLRRALADDALRVVFQPVLGLQSGRWGGPEALVRIDDPDQGELSPAAFIEVAEDTGLIVDIDRRVLRTSLQHFASWGDLRGAGVHVVSVNVSARSIEQHGFADAVIDLLEETGVDGAALRLEVTERTLLQASPTAVDAFRRLSDLGVGFGIDDFGTGYSALAYLQRFPLHFLKIDRSFTSRLGQSRRDDALVAAIVALGHAQDLHVVAEGVETDEQLAALRAAGCDFGQGYLLGRPMDADDFAAHVRGQAPLSRREPDRGLG